MVAPDFSTMPPTELAALEEAARKRYEEAYACVASALPTIRDLIEENFTKGGKLVSGEPTWQLLRNDVAELDDATAEWTDIVRVILTAEKTAETTPSS
jgi:hypothetical protein